MSDGCNLGRERHVIIPCRHSGGSPCCIRPCCLAQQSRPHCCLPCWLRSRSLIGLRTNSSSACASVLSDCCRHRCRWNGLMLASSLPKWKRCAGVLLRECGYESLKVGWKCYGRANGCL
nr:hypothetical protein B14D6.670 [imported] - Neurospora crassa [Neurospora crassa]